MGTATAAFGAFEALPEGIESASAEPIEAAFTTGTCNRKHDRKLH
jgi:hypothetical protein